MVNQDGWGFESREHQLRYRDISNDQHDQQSIKGNGTVGTPYAWDRCEILVY